MTTILVAGVLAIAFSLLGRETWGWLPRLSRGVIWLHTLSLPPARRRVRREEWPAELAAEYEDRRVAGLLWASGLARISVWESLTATLRRGRDQLSEAEVPSAPDVPAARALAATPRTSSRGDGAYELELLSGRHRIDGFGSGNPEADLAVLRLHERVRERDMDDVTAVAATNAAGDVLGIVSIIDLHLAAEESHSASSGDWVFYQLLAIDKGHQKDSVLLGMLLAELIRIGRRRLSKSSRYRGEMTSLYLLEGNIELRDRVARFLTVGGFAALEDDPGFWFRPRSSADRDSTAPRWRRAQAPDASELRPGGG